MKIQFTDFRVYGSTPLSLGADTFIKTRGRTLAMGGDDTGREAEVGRGKGTESTRGKRRMEGVV